MTGLKDYYENVLGLSMTSLLWIDADLVFARRVLGGQIEDIAFGDALYDVSEADGRTIDHH